MEPKITSCNLKVENAMQEGLMAQMKLLFWWNQQTYRKKWTELI